MANEVKFRTAIIAKSALTAESTVIFSALTANRALILNGSGEVTHSATTDTELGYLSGVTSAVQTQLNDKFSKSVDDSDDITEGATNLFFSDEKAQDAVGGMVANSANVSLTYVDGTPSLTADLIDTSVSAGSYGSSSQVGSFTVDAKGRLTAASNTSIDHGSISGLGDDDHTQYILAAGTRAFSGNQSMGGNKLTSVGAPTTSTDAATKGYVDSVAEGLKPKTAARVATTADIAIATALNSGDSIDGVTLADGDRVLVKDQIAAEENGIYIVGASPARSTDFDSLSPIDEINGALVAVQEGSTHAGKVFVQSGTVAVLDTDPISFVFFNSAATLVGGDGITVSGSNVSVDHDGQGLQFVTTQLALELDGSTLSKSASGLKLSDTAVTPGSYGSASSVGTFTVDAQGRLTAAASTSISITASQVSDFNEAAQDAVGGALTDSASIDLTYDDGANTITAAVIPGGVDHDSLQNFVANEHVDHSAVVLSGAANGGITSSIGDITASRSISVDITNATAETSVDNADLVLIHDNSAGALRKMTRANFLSGVGLQTGDIAPTSFAGDEGETNVAVTGLAFANGTVRSFEAQVQIVVDATTDLYEVYHLSGVQKSGSWEMSQQSTGDETLVTFSINSSGQVLYSSAVSYPGFVSLTIKFRATALPL